jgi:spore germination cell wall hydrolase CwlJ-like protein
MVASRIGVLGGYFSARFWLSACAIALMPTSIGYQDLAALITHGRAPASGWHLIASPFGTVQAATFSYTRPVGSGLPGAPGLFQNVNFDPRSLDSFSWKIDEPITARPARQVEYPSVDRSGKGDRLPVAVPAPQPANLVPANLPPQPANLVPANLPQLQPIDAPAMAPSVPAPNTMTRPKSAEALPADPREDESLAWVSRDDDTALLDTPPELPAPGESVANQSIASLDALSMLNETDDHSAQIYFGNGVMGAPSGLQSWTPGAEPILITPPEAPGTKASGTRLAVLETPEEQDNTDVIAGKDNSRLLSPAQQLGLIGKPRARAEKCLADAVYFEARGEVLKGQQAVAQVVMNRVFSGVYPHDVCGVVYQNSNRHLACQFTFACEGKDLDKKDEPDMWEQAKRISKDMLDGKIWLSEVGHATHYHAYWVHPSWVHEMAKLYRLGVHTFYRPLNWGKGDDEPVWGQGPANVGVRLDPEVLNEDPEPAPKAPSKVSERPEKAPQAAAAADKSDPTAKL